MWVEILSGIATMFVPALGAIIPMVGKWFGLKKEAQDHALQIELAKVNGASAYKLAVAESAARGRVKQYEGETAMAVAAEATIQESYKLAARGVVRERFDFGDGWFARLTMGYIEFLHAHISALRRSVRPVVTYGGILAFVLLIDHLIDVNIQNHGFALSSEDASNLLVFAIKQFILMVVATTLWWFGSRPHSIQQTEVKHAN